MDDNQGQDNVFVLLKSFSHYSAKKYTSVAKLKRVLVQSQCMLKVPSSSGCASIHPSSKRDILITASVSPTDIFEIDNNFNSRQLIDGGDRYNHSHITTEKYTIGTCPGYKVNVYDNNTKQVVYTSKKTLIRIIMPKTGKYNSMYNSKWIAVHGNTLYYLSNDCRLNNVDILNSREGEVVLFGDTNNKDVVDFHINAYGTLVVMTDDGYLARSETVVKLGRSKQYYHLLRAGKRFLCIGYDEDGNEMILCIVNIQCSSIKMYKRLKVMYAPYCVTTAPLGDENGDQFLLFVGEFWNITRVSTYMIIRTIVHLIDVRQLIVESQDNIWAMMTIKDTLYAGTGRNGIYAFKFK